MTDFKFTSNGNLSITIDADDRERIEESREPITMMSDDNIFLDIIERQLCNGWDLTEIALYGGLVLTEELEQGDHGEILSLGKVYAWTSYPIISEIEALLADGTIILIMFE